MQLVFLYLLPVFCCYDMTQRMGVVVLYHFRVTSGAGGKVNDHGILCSCCSSAGRTSKFSRECSHFIMKAVPAFSCRPDYNLVLNAGNRGLCLVYLFQNIGIIYTDHCVDFRAVSAVDQVFLCQLQGTGNQNCADFMKRNGTYPVFPPAAENQHNNSALPNAQAQKVICSLIGQTGNVCKGKGFFFFVIITPNKSLLFWFLFCPFVHDIKAEVEIIRNVEAIVLLEVLVAVKFNTRKVFVEQHMQMLLFLEILL